ncbi:MAG: 5-dehydro-2-deoxygluconokinase [Hyphomicrobiales bacterium]|nr:5-dehydro-2-deoxygluconokinase [Hyphomicrobiales bacterium]MDE2115102.1 5-dehydro-2-deoxygluconokinase [Hyphomicrobiales bacterium]
MKPTLDVITIGRASVDLYGQQIGGRLEDMASFSKAVGGCPANIAIGAARLGLRSGLITRVGDEHMGRFIREQLQREGVDVAGVHTDPARLTALVLLGVRDDKTFPLIFYRDNCADAALDVSDIDEAYIASAGAIVVTGTHFAKPGPSAAQMRAMEYARKHGRKICFDIDYRPNLWGLAGHGAGESRYVKSGEVSALLRPVLPQCDLIVGTEEEMMIAGDADDPLQALVNVRAHTKALLVLKRGPMGCSVFPGAIPASLDEGIRGPGFPVEVFNVLGAGDAFMAGFLRGYLRDEPIETCCAYANAGGAFAVSRLLCSVEYPTFTELNHFLKSGVKVRALREDGALNHLHWVTTKDRLFPNHAASGIMALAIDHRAQLEEMADAAGAPRAKINDFKVLALEAALSVANGREGFGMLLDGRLGREALFRAAGEKLWIARPVERPGSRPLDFEGNGSLAAFVMDWPQAHVIKALCFYHPDDPAEMRASQERQLLRLKDTAGKLGHEWLLEIISSKNGPVDDHTLARVLRGLYALDIRPDWWKLETQPSPAAWANIAHEISTNDPNCRGIMLLGLDAPEAQLAQGFAVAATCPWVKGFAVGRTIFGKPAQAWLKGEITDDEARRQMSDAFARLVNIWNGARTPSQEKAL